MQAIGEGSKTFQDRKKNLHQLSRHISDPIILSKLHYKPKNTIGLHISGLLFRPALHWSLNKDFAASGRQVQERI